MRLIVRFVADNQARVLTYRPRLIWAPFEKGSGGGLDTHLGAARVVPKTGAQPTSDRHPLRPPRGVSSAYDSSCATFEYQAGQPPSCISASVNINAVLSEIRLIYGGMSV